MRKQALGRIIVQCAAALACLFGAAFAHAERGREPQRLPAGIGAGYVAHWGLRPSYGGFDAAPQGAYRPVSEQWRPLARQPENGEGGPPRGGSIRDAVTRYNEERGGERPFPPPPRARADDPRSAFPSFYRN